MPAELDAEGLAVRERTMLAIRQRVHALTGEYVDGSVEDFQFVLDAAMLNYLTQGTEERDALKRRFRKRDVLVAQAVMMLRTAKLEHPLGQTYIDNVAERLIDALGVALLIEDDDNRPDTATIRTGEKEEYTHDEFMAMQGGGAPRRGAVNSAPTTDSEETEQ